MLRCNHSKIYYLSYITIKHDYYQCYMMYPLSVFLLICVIVSNVNVLLKLMLFYSHVLYGFEDYIFLSARIFDFVID